MRYTEAQAEAVAARTRFKLRAVTRPESDILAEVMASLWRHPLIAWCARINQGAFTRTNEETGKREFYRFTTIRSSLALDFLRPHFPEQFDALRRATLKMPDVLGMTRGGRLIAIECKRLGVKPMAGQAAFMDLVLSHGGIAGVVRSGKEAMDLVEGSGRADHD